jgi:hypothetical protein
LDAKQLRLGGFEKTDAAGPAGLIWADALDFGGFCLPCAWFRNHDALKATLATVTTCSTEAALLCLDLLLLWCILGVILPR